MHSERVLRKEQFFFFQIGEHAVRPVKHLRFDKRKSQSAEINAVTRLDRSQTVADMELRIKNADAHCGGVDDFGFEIVDHFRERAGVIRLRMVRNDDLDFRRVDHGRNAGVHLLFERRLDGVDQRRLFAEHEICVVGCSAVCVIPVKFLEVPVDRSDPPDLVGDFYSFE